MESKKINELDTRVLRVCDLWFVFQHNCIVYPKNIQIFNKEGNVYNLASIRDFEEWYFEERNYNSFWEIFEMNFGEDEDSYISVVKGEVD